MKRISKNTMEKKNIFAPLATGLGATRRAAMLLLVMMLTMAQTAWAQGGSCGNHVTWSLAAHTLTISGEGNMWDYDDVMNTAPWNSYAEQIQEVVIENGVTSIGAYAFYGTGLTSIEIPASVEKIEPEAFLYCNQLMEVRSNIRKPFAISSMSSGNKCRFSKSSP